MPAHGEHNRFGSVAASGHELGGGAGESIAIWFVHSASPGYGRDHFSAKENGEALSDMPLEIGQTLLGKYRFLAFVGQGGFGRVYLAEEVRTHGRVAIKELRHDLPEEQQREARDRFEREIDRSENRSGSGLDELGSGLDESTSEGSAD